MVYTLKRRFKITLNGETYDGTLHCQATDGQMDQWMVVDFRELDDFFSRLQTTELPKRISRTVEGIAAMILDVAPYAVKVEIGKDEANRIEVSHD